MLNNNMVYHSTHSADKTDFSCCKFYRDNLKRLRILHLFLRTRTEVLYKFRVFIKTIVKTRLI